MIVPFEELVVVAYYKPHFSNIISGLRSSRNLLLHNNTMAVLLVFIIAFALPILFRAFLILRAAFIIVVSYFTKSTMPIKYRLRVMLKMVNMLPGIITVALVLSAMFFMESICGQMVNKVQIRRHPRAARPMTMQVNWRCQG